MVQVYGGLLHCAIFQLLIKSMSKMHNIIPSTRLVGFSSLSPLGSSFHSTSKLGYFHDQLGKLNPVKSSVELIENFSTDTKNERHTSEEQTVRFSRFSAWHLTHMAENKEVERSTQQNRALLDTFEDQPDSAQNQEKCNYLTPGTTYKSNDCAEKDFCSFSSPPQNTKNPKKQKIIKPKQTGLRKLSGKAFNIVKELGEATYKEVASKLIQSIMNDESSFDDEKEQNNIKRRVYDALNVLIAMEILRKSGKNISYGHDPNERAKGSRRQFLISIMTQKQQLLKRKREKKQRLMKQKKAVECLLNRNRNLSKVQDYVVVPMLCLEAQSLQKISLSSNCSQLHVKSNRLKIHQGLDTIVNLFVNKLQ